MIDLCDRRDGDSRQLALAELEVRELRARLADLSVAKDEIESRLEHRRQADDRVRELLEELARVQRDAATDRFGP